MAQQGKFYEVEITYRLHWYAPDGLPPILSEVIGVAKDDCYAQDFYADEITSIGRLKPRGEIYTDDGGKVPSDEEIAQMFEQSRRSRQEQKLMAETPTLFQTEL